MKTALIAVLALGFMNIAKADDTQTILDNTLVKSTYELMTLKNLKCEPLTEKSIHWMCTGALFPVSKPTLIPSGCGLAVEITCTATSATVYGSKRSVFLQDATGIRNDVEAMDLGISFDSVSTRTSIK